MSHRTALALSISYFIAALYCVIAASNVWPAIDGDGAAYFTPAVEWSRGHALVNPVWLPPLNDSIDGSGSRRYVYHGFLYQMVVGKIGRSLGAAPGGAVRAAYLIHWLAAVLTSAAILIWSQFTGIWRTLAAIVLPIAMLALSVSCHGRMEPLAILLIGAATLCWYFVASPWRETCVGITVSLLAFTSPTCGALAGVVLLIALFAVREPIRLEQVFGAAIGMLCASVAAIWWYPYPISDWIGGVWRHSHIYVSLTPFQGFVTTWLTRPDLPSFLLSFGVIAIGAISWLFHRGREINRGWILWIPAFVFMLALWRLAFVKSEAVYNAVVWTPLLACLAAANRQSSLRAAMLVLALLAPVAGLTRNALLLASSRSEAPSFAQLHERLATVDHGELAVSSGLWLAVDNPVRVQVTPSDAPTGSTFVEQQAYTGRSSPRQYDGYRLVENRFGPPITLLGLPISRGSSGWSYAVYVRDITAQ